MLEAPQIEAYRTPFRLPAQPQYLRLFRYPVLATWDICCENTSRQID